MEKLKCRNNNCMRSGNFDNGLCPKCTKSLNNWHNAKTKSKIKRQSSNTYPKALREAKASFQQLRRIEEADNNGIVICEDGSRCLWSKCDGGHYIPAKYLATCFQKENVNPQRKVRNLNMDDPTISLGYRSFMISKYGIDVVEQIERDKHVPKKYTVFELEIMKADYDSQILKHRKRLNIL
jgi:hypothetical protein